MNRLLLQIFITLLLSLSITFSHSRSWQVVGNMPLPVYGAEAVAIDTTIYILGGYSDSTQSTVRWIQAYYPNSNTWRVLGNMKRSRFSFLADTLSHHIFYTGGNSFDSTMEILDPSLPSDYYDTNQIFYRSYSTGLIHNQNFYFIGGTNLVMSSPARSTYIAEYNIQSKTITYVDTSFLGTQLPESQMAVAINNSILILGGEYNSVRTDINSFNTQSHIRTRFPSHLITPRAGGRAVRYANSDSIFVIGGYNESHYALASTEVLSVGTDTTITMGPPLHYARRRPAAIMFNNSIYVFGGYDQFHNIVDSIERLTIVDDIKEPDEIVSDFSLFQNFPNPFNPSTLIKFRMQHSGFVSLDIFSIDGKHIISLFNGHSSIGLHEIEWSGKDKSGNSVASGIYIYTLSSVDFTTSRKMVLVR